MPIPGVAEQGTQGEDWHLVWGWWPMPVFVRDLVGEDRCCNVVASIAARTVANRFLIPFALALEHRRQPIKSEFDLEAVFTKVCAPDFDLNEAVTLYRSECNARWARIAQENADILARMPKAPDHPEVFQRMLEAKQLPAGRSENIARMREILPSKTKRIEGDPIA